MRRRRVWALVLPLAISLAGSALASPNAPLQLPSPEEAIARLREGNRRYVERHPTHPHQETRVRLELSHGQAPFAVLVSCSDSRVTPSVVFDQGLGDLFEIRTAGHVLDGAALGSIEYAVEHLHTPLVVVMGHDRCGAVTAAIRAGSHPGHLQRIVDAIRPAVRRVRMDQEPIDLGWRRPGPEHLRETQARANFLGRTILANVESAVEGMLGASELIHEAVARGRTRVIGAFYDLDSGEVDLDW